MKLNLQLWKPGHDSKFAVPDQNLKTILIFFDKKDFMTFPLNKKGQPLNCPFILPVLLSCFRGIFKLCELV